MASRYRENGATPRQGDYSAFRCGYAMEVPDFVVTLTVSQARQAVAVVVDLERSEVPDALHRLRDLFPLSAGYDITAMSKERSQS